MPNTYLFQTLYSFPPNAILLKVGVILIASEKTVIPCPGVLFNEGLSWSNMSLLLTLLPPFTKAVRTHLVNTERNSGLI